MNIKQTVMYQRTRHHADGNVYNLQPEIIDTCSKFCSLIIKAELAYGAQIREVDSSKFVLQSSFMGCVDIVTVENFTTPSPEFALMRELLNLMVAYVPGQGFLNFMPPRGMTPGPIHWLSKEASRTAGALFIILNQSGVIVDTHLPPIEMMAAFELLMEGSNPQEISYLLNSVPSQGLLDIPYHG